MRKGKHEGGRKKERKKTLSSFTSILSLIKVPSLSLFSALPLCPSLSLSLPPPFSSVQPRLYFLQERRRRALPPDVRRLRSLRRVRQRSQHGPREPVREVGEVEVAEHHRRREERRGRVGDSPPRDVSGDWFGFFLIFWRGSRESELLDRK